MIDQRLIIKIGDINDSIRPLEEAGRAPSQANQKSQLAGLAQTFRNEIYQNSRPAQGLRHPGGFEKRLKDCVLWVRGLMFRRAIAAAGRTHQGAPHGIRLTVNHSQECSCRP